MRNLKKVLSLALVFVMVFALAVSASAAYTDQDKINDKYETAVDLLSAIKVINGKASGQFDPTGNVTRAEMAKMIYVAANGADDSATLYAGLSTKFEDLAAANWAVNYVKWANFKGIVAGTSATTFRPMNNVTGVQAAKMILTMMGFNADIEGYQKVSNWEFNVIDDAKTYGLLTDLDYSCVSRALTREEAAKMICNGISKDVKVTYNDKNVGNYDTTTADTSILNDVFNVKSDKAILLKTETAGLGGVAAKGKVEFYKANTDGTYGTLTATDGALTATLTVKGSTDVELGHEVIVYYKNNDDKDLYAVMETGASKTVTALPTTPAPSNGLNLAVKDGKVEDAATAGTYVLRTVDGTTYKDFTIQNTTTLGKAAVASVAATSDAAAYTSLAVKTNVGGDGADVFTATKNSDVIGGEAIADKDVVLVTKQWTSGNTYKFAVKKAESITGAITAVSSDGKKVTIGGTRYDVSKITGFSTNLTDATAIKAILNQPGTFYLADGAVAAFVPDAATTDKYALLLDVQNKGEDDGLLGAQPDLPMVYAVLDNGTVGAIEVASATGALTDLETTYVATKEAPCLVTYTMKGDKIALGSVALAGDAYTSAAGKFSKYTGGAKITLTTGSTPADYIVDDATVFFMKSGDSFKAYAGKANAPAIAADTVGAVIEGSGARAGKADAIVLKADNAGTDAALAYLLSYSISTDADGLDYYTLTMFDGTSVKEFESIHASTEALAAAVATTPGFVTYTMKDGKVKTVAEAGENDLFSGRVVSYEKGVVIKLGTTVYNVASDCAVWTIDTTNGTATAGADITVGAADADTTSTVSITTNVSGEVTAIYLVK